jgi:nucleotide-binding universal stress UspA family protein
MARMKSQAVKIDQSPAKASPLKALAVIDGSERTGRLIEYAIAMAQSGRPLEMILLAVIPRPPDGRLRGYGSFKQDEVYARLADVADRRAVDAAALRFERAGIAHVEYVEVGDPVETILRIVRRDGCELILIADAPAGRLQRLLTAATGLQFATIQSQIVQQATTPVVIIK